MEYICVCLSSICLSIWDIYIYIKLEMVRHLIGKKSYGYLLRNLTLKKVPAYTRVQIIIFAEYRERMIGYNLLSYNSLMGSYIISFLDDSSYYHLTIYCVPFTNFKSDNHHLLSAC